MVFHQLIVYWRRPYNSLRSFITRGAPITGSFCAWPRAVSTNTYSSTSALRNAVGTPSCQISQSISTVAASTMQMS